ncbi:MAG: hypothetical protein LUD03_05350 [Firmicutes bacterium]|nr:hypothetical protein [Bacillota bacterium]
MPKVKLRYFIIRVIMIIMFGIIAFTLFDLQVIDGEKNNEYVNNKLVTNIVATAPRGEILDRYGKPLVTNKVGYSIIMQDVGNDDEQINAVLGTLLDIMYSTGCTFYDELPICEYPYEFTFTDENGDGSSADERAEWFEKNPYLGKGIEANMSADEIMNALADIYKIDGSYDVNTQRKMISIRYAAKLRGMSATVSYTIADDISVETVTQIKERQSEITGISIVNSYVREYTNPGIATHLLGRTGKINSDEYASYSDLGYGINDVIGKQGIEKWAESYLRGKDGTIGTAQDDDVEASIITEPVPGDYVITTLDIELQKVAEESLESTIKTIQQGDSDGKGTDCDAGAVVVLDVNTGDTLAMASYPTYDMSTFDEDYSTLLEDSATPLVNRAVAGLYSPGSTFKPLTAIAAIQSGNLTVNEVINDEGVYRYYDSYQPVCWIWSEYGTTHGRQNVTQAIENSCNYFFYEVGRRTGIDTLDEYAAKFGLGEYTEIELPEEASGHMASPEYKKEVENNVTSSDWYGGDTLQAAIGQSYSLFTPVQLANYAATIANGGTRYKVNLIKSIRSSVDGSVVKTTEPTVEEYIDISDDALDAIKDGMKKVVDDGSASSIFSNYEIQIGGKTGTAQVGNGSNNAIFIAYAPFDDPEIAVAVVLEHGVKGTNAGYVAKDIFDYYFELNEEASPSPSATDAAEEE